MKKLAQFCITAAERYYGKQLFMAMDSVQSLKLAHTDAFEKLMAEKQKLMTESSDLIKAKDEQISSLEEKSRSQLTEAHRQQEELRHEITEKAELKAKDAVDDAKRLHAIEMKSVEADAKRALENEEQKKKIEIQALTQQTASLQEEIDKLKTTLTEERNEAVLNLKKSLDDANRLHAAELKSAEADVKRAVEDGEQKKKIENQALTQKATSLQNEVDKLNITLQEERNEAVLNLKKTIEDANRLHAAELKAAEADAKRAIENGEQKKKIEIQALAQQATSLQSEIDKLKTTLKEERNEAAFNLKKSIEDANLLHAAELKTSQADVKRAVENGEQKEKMVTHKFTLEVQRLNEKIAALQNEIVNLNKAIKEERSEAALHLKRSLEDAQRHHKAELRSVEAKADRAIEQGKHEKELLVEQHTNRIEEERRRSSSHQTLAEMFGVELKQGMESITQLITADKNQKVKGAEGEQMIRNFLHEHYGAHGVEKVDGKKNSADIKLTYKSKTILFEVRNYDSSVPKDKRDSLKRDVDAQNADGGILVSLRSGIVGMDDFEIEITPDKTPLVYLHNVGADLSKLKGAVSMVIQASKNSQLFNTDEISKCRTHLDSDRDCIRELVRPIREIESLQKRLLSNNKEHMFLMKREKVVIDNMDTAALKDLLDRYGEPTTGTKEVLKKRILESNLGIKSAAA